jgi:hypothetical protein
VSLCLQNRNISHGRRIVGAGVAGRLSDHIIIKWRKLRMGKWVPEDRLRAALLAAGVLVLVPVLVSSVVTKYVSGTPGMGINLACLFIAGAGVRSWSVYEKL